MDKQLNKKEIYNENQDSDFYKYVNPIFENDIKFQKYNMDSTTFMAFDPKLNNYKKLQGIYNEITIDDYSNSSYSCNLTLFDPMVSSQKNYSEIVEYTKYQSFFPHEKMVEERKRELQNIYPVDDSYSLKNGYAPYSYEENICISKTRELKDYCEHLSKKIPTDHLRSYNERAMKYLVGEKK